VKTGKLFVVATPIGNPKDITLRALDVLKKADIVICEEYRAGSTLLKKIGIPEKELITFNEHNNEEQLPLITNMLIVEGKNLALISDCGTPVFADPGQSLIRQAVSLGIPVTPIPGPSSLMAALSILDISLDQFLFGGFLSRKPEVRKRELETLRRINMPIILMDTPYRLVSVLESVQDVFGKKCRITLAADLTQKTETIYRDQVSAVIRNLKKKKAQFILIIHR
jgi:16S rRNA (cytidine1402-2'-O)-methyltransferase